MDSKELYFETLQIFSEEDHRQEMESLFEQEDWDNYRIRAHSLKSTSRTIGAVVFSEHARCMEMALKDRDPEYVRSHHRELMSEYGELLAMILKIRGDKSNE
jgi:HPt (histidine-containing phosphotransfer) domain-containing protein